MRSQRLLAVGYEYWNSWVKKHNKILTVRLTKREFQSFWAWFSTRINTHSKDSGIEINRIVDDFLTYGICHTRAAAVELMYRIDTDGDGSISFDEFITGMTSGTDIQQVLSLRKFVSSLQPNGMYKTSSDGTSAKSSADSITQPPLPSLQKQESFMAVVSFELSSDPPEDTGQSLPPVVAGSPSDADMQSFTPALTPPPSVPPTPRHPPGKVLRTALAHVIF